jgi:hypothetical protein
LQVRLRQKEISNDMIIVYGVLECEGNRSVVQMCRKACVHELIVTVTLWPVKCKY